MESGRGTGAVIRSLRMPKALDEDLKKIADERRSSVNALAEAALQKFVDFDSHSEEFGYCVTRKEFLKKAFDYLTDLEVRELGDWAGRGLGSETVKYHHLEGGIEAVLSTYQDIWARYAGTYTVKHETRGNQHTLHLSHNMGMKWSIFYEAQMKALFEKNSGVKVRTELSPNFVTVRFVT